MIVGHQNLLSEVLTRVIFSFHMPFFFIISGLFWHRISFRQTLVKTFRTLILPFFLLTSVWCCYYIVCYLINDISLTKIIPYVVGSFISPGKDFFDFRPLCCYLWFLLALAIIKLICSLFTSEYKLWEGTIIVSVIGICVSQMGYNLPFALDSALLAFPFFILGHTLSPYIMRHYTIYTELIVLCLTLFLTIFLGINNGIVDINKCLYGDSYIIFLVVGLSGSVMIVTFSRLLSRVFENNLSLVFLLNKISSGLLLVVAFSAMLTGVLRDMFKLLFPSIETASNLYGILIGVVVLLTYSPVITLVQRYFPAIIGFRK